MDRRSATSRPRPRRPSAVWVALCTAGGIAAAVYWLQGHLGLNLADEGFLWYGTANIALDHFPIVDFQAYAPGRYVLGAALSPFWGTGPLGVRATAHVALAVALFAAARIAQDITDRPGAPSMFAFVLVVTAWMLPWWKYVDIAVIAVLTVTFVRVSVHGRVRDFGWHGMTVGAASFFGQNHAMYAAAGTLLLLVLQRVITHRWVTRSHVRAFASGLAAGLLPWALAAVLVPELPQALVRWARMIMDRGTSNLALAIPWPWSPGLGPSASRTGVAFVAALAVLGVALAVVLWRGAPTRVRTWLIGPVSIAVPSLYHFLSRADLPHLAQVALPILVIVLVLAYEASNRWPVATIALATMLVVGTMIPLRAQPFMQLTVPRVATEEVVVGQDRLEVSVGSARLLDDARAVVERIGDVSFLAVPTLPGMYGLADRRSPTWTLFTGAPAPEDIQQSMIRDLDREQVEWIVIGRGPRGPEGEVTFDQTHGLVWGWIEDRYRAVPTPGVQSLTVYRRHAPSR